MVITTDRVQIAIVQPPMIKIVEITLNFFHVVLNVQDEEVPDYWLNARKLNVQICAKKQPRCIVWLSRPVIGWTIAGQIPDGIIHTTWPVQGLGFECCFSREFS